MTSADRPRPNAAYEPYGSPNAQNAGTRDLARIPGAMHAAADRGNRWEDPYASDEHTERRNPTTALRDAVTAAGGPADVTVVCVDVPGCEGGAILSTAEGGTVIFFSMATSFSAAALGAEGLAADVTMLVGNGYVPGHADYALSLLRGHAGVRGLFERRL